MIKLLGKDSKFVSNFKERPFGVVNRIHVSFDTRMKFFKAPAG